jgi:putative addiction module component (TIGR02574 family)
MNKTVRDQALQMTPAERLELIGDLWDSLDGADMPPLTQEQIEEFDRRLAEYERDPSRGIPLEEFLARLESRYG